jgi:hypothetical protein
MICLYFSLNLPFSISLYLFILQQRSITFNIHFVLFQRIFSLVIMQVICDVKNIGDYSLIFSVQFHHLHYIFLNCFLYLDLLVNGFLMRVHHSVGFGFLSLIIFFSYFIECFTFGFEQVNFILEGNTKLLLLYINLLVAIFLIFKLFVLL